MRRVAVVGAGYSTVGRRTGLSARDLTRQCVLAALDDAGLTNRDVDGFTSVGGEPLGDAHMLGMHPLSYFTSGMAVPAFSWAAHEAITAVASGRCETAVATRIIQQQPTGDAQLSQAGAARAAGVGGDFQFLLPFGAGMPPQWAGLLTNRRMQEFGETEEHYAAHVVAQRHHASMNEDALFRDPITPQDYYDARYVSKPVRILDCDYPVDSGSAVIFTTEERARDLRQKPVYLDAWALSAVSELNFELLPDMLHTAPHHCAELLWGRTSLTAADVDVAGLYDGFSFIVFEWLEALGFCAAGEAGRFIADGQTRLGGAIPVNTDGGACNVGRRHGANFCIETLRQLRGQSGDRQVPGAEVAVWTNAVGPFAAAFLMTV